MTVDKNLFLHDFAVVAILKNEGHYLKEWLDYHLLAGVDHFYLYDNESSDNYNAIIAPYVEAGLVTNKYISGQSAQFAAYNDAVLNYRFQCRYMAFIDLDEFIFPKTNQSVVEVVDEILSHDPNAAGLVINWQLFGSNGQDKADYTRGVLERFTQRAPSDWITDNMGNAHVKTISKPRLINFFHNPHFAVYFEEIYALNETGLVVNGPFNSPVTFKKIVINHYYTKSCEEFFIKRERGRSDINLKYSVDWFDRYNRNEVFDDGILRYRAVRAENFSLENIGEKYKRVKDALTKILLRYADGETFDLETALTCRAASNYLREKLYEEASLAAILKSLDGLTLADVRLLLSELPNLLSLPYPVVEELRGACLHIIPQMMNVMRLNTRWKDYVELDYIWRLLQIQK